MNAPTRFRLQRREDARALLALMGAYYQEEGYPFDRQRTAALLDELRVDHSLGAVWVVDADEDADETDTKERQLAAYLVVTLGRSFEYGGRDAFIDELFVAEDFRGRGLGTRALRVAEEHCLAQGGRALHLEVEPHRTRAAALYRGRGYSGNGRTLLTKRFTAPSEDP